ncbi:MAG TPA: hypothetical protein VIM11_20390, partial [Tepidisphaeraceae bacterium]
IKAREEAEKAGRVFIPTKPTRFSRLTKADEPAEPQSNGWIARLWAAWNKILEKAEDARKEQERKDKKK